MLSAVTHQQQRLVHVAILTFELQGACNLEVSEAIDLSLAQQVSIDGVDVLLLQTLVDVDDVL